ncbi:hypothetical protein MLD38_021662 [Melastoma candidum]|uniref:Uncharacterized protein n=1 Tax=Melastoma candidum TaxID=119954 RepID=A0ACB9QG61_9MYRT|nr:hypothetical protein MLD38_021662 [Melastoma candidum]
MASSPAGASVDSPASYFPKENQVLELVCESLAYKGRGVCKVSDTGFVFFFDRPLPGERFPGRVTRRKGSYAEVTKLRMITPHRYIVEAPCEYVQYCRGCKTQNLLYEAQVRAKEQQFHELITHAGKFDVRGLEFQNVMQPIVPSTSISLSEQNGVLFWYSKMASERTAG